MLNVPEAASVTPTMFLHTIACVGITWYFVFTIYYVGAVVVRKMLIKNRHTSYILFRYCKFCNKVQHLMSLNA